MEMLVLIPQAQEVHLCIACRCGVKLECSSWGEENMRGVGCQPNYLTDAGDFAAMHDTCKTYSLVMDTRSIVDSVSA